MNDLQKMKRNFRNSKAWKDFKQVKFLECERIDLITGHKLRKGWQLHHRNLDESKYEVLNPAHFLCCNNLTHKMLHWLFTYYKKDPAIIDRLKSEMEKMQEINSDADKR